MRSSLTLITPPAVAPVTLAEAKAQSRISHADDDDLVAALIEAATAHVENVTQRALVEQTWELRLDEFPCYPGALLWHPRQDWIGLPRPPLRQVASVQYVDPDGALQTLAPSAYQVVAGGWGSSRLAPAYEQDWPDTRDEPDAVRVLYTAGYAAPTMDSPPVAGPGVPQPILAAIKLYFGHLYENREAVLVDPRAPPEVLPEGVAALLGPYRVGVLG